MARPFDRTDPETAREVFENLFSAPDTRRRLLEVLADTIERAHAANPDSWSVTLPFHRRGASLNVGPIFAVGFEPDEVSLILPTREGVPPRLHKDSPTEPAGTFAALPNVAWFRFAPAELLERWEAIREDHLQAVDQAATKVQRTPYARSFSPAIVGYAEQVLGRELPRPGHAQEVMMDEEVVDRVVSLVQRLYPDWTGFDHPRFRDEEIDYKRTAATQARESLAEDQLRIFLHDEQHDELLDRLQALARATNLLYQGTPSSGDLSVLHADALDAPSFCAAVVDLLYGNGPSSERLERFSAYLAERELPNKWTLPTYLLFLRFPETDLFVKPGVTRWFLKLADADEAYSSRPSGELYELILEHARSLLAELEPQGARDMIDVQSALFVAHAATQEAETIRPSAAKRREMESLFEEFVRTYLTTPEGQAHQAAYEASREQGRKNFQSILQARDAGGDVTDRVLRDLLPHKDSETHRQDGSWIHVAPAIMGNVKGFFEAAGWRQPGDWAHVARAILQLVDRAVNDPSELEAACQEFAKLGWSRGFQTGMLTPILNALRPDDYLLVNNKSRRFINYLSGKSLSAKLTDYPELNRIGHLLVGELADLLEGAPGGHRTEDVFDAFADWLTTVRKFPFGDPQYWKIAPGENAKYWNDCLTGGFISVGWNELGDLTRVSREEFERRRDKILVENPDWAAGRLEQVWKFAKEIREGDKIVANDGTSRVLGFGTVSGPYEYVPDVSHSHRLPVDWDDTEPREVDEGGWRRTLIRLDQQKHAALLSSPREGKKGGNGRTPPPSSSPRSVNPTYPLTDCAAELRMDRADLERWTRAIERKKQAIFYGPPGTGKTYVARALARHLIGGGDGFQELVQFHPSYAYEDFIQGIRPEPLPEGGLDYPVKRGRFLEFCSRAREREAACVLIIDEINRANLSRVFGELMYLLEYRDEAIPLAAGSEHFSIPENVRILGTMNTADRSIALVDHALRRRFAFLPLRPSYETLTRFHEGNGYDVQPLVELLHQINLAIADPHHEVGITFFLHDDLPDVLEDIWTMEILPYLEEYFFDQRDRVDQFRWDVVREPLGL